MPIITIDVEETCTYALHFEVPGDLADQLVDPSNRYYATEILDCFEVDGFIFNEVSRVATNAEGHPHTFYGVDERDFGPPEVGTYVKQGAPLPSAVERELRKLFTEVEEEESA